MGQYGAEWGQYGGSMGAVWGQFTERGAVVRGCAYQ